MNRARGAVLWFLEIQGAGSIYRATPFARIAGEMIVEER